MLTHKMETSLDYIILAHYCIIVFSPADEKMVNIFPVYANCWIDALELVQVTYHELFDVVTLYFLWQFIL